MENQKRKNLNLLCISIIFILLSCNNKEISNVKSTKETILIDKIETNCSNKFSVLITTFNNIEKIDSLLLMYYIDSTFKTEIGSYKLKLINKSYNIPNNINRKVWNFTLGDSLDSRLSYKIIFQKNINAYYLTNIKMGTREVVIGDKVQNICSLKSYRLNKKVYNGVDINLW